MGKGVKALSVATVCSVLDMGLTLVGIAWDGTDFTFNNVAACFASATPSQYDFRTNPIDFFVTSLLRIVVYFTGASMIAADSVAGPDRVRKITGPMFCVCLLMWAFSPTKLLAFAEMGDNLHPGQWFCMAWNFIAALILHLVWNRSFVATKAPASTRSSTGDRATLLDNEHRQGDEEAPEDVIVKAKETFELMGRLLQYCKREWVWHMSGFTWLFIYALSKWSKVIGARYYYFILFQLASSSPTILVRSLPPLSLLARTVN